VHDPRKAFNALSRIMRALPRGCSRVTFHLEDRLSADPKMDGCQLLCSDGGRRTATVELRPGHQESPGAAKFLGLAYIDPRIQQGGARRRQGAGHLARGGKSIRRPSETYGYRRAGE
jgi:hypothetical protein